MNSILAGKSGVEGGGGVCKHCLGHYKCFESATYLVTVRNEHINLCTSLCKVCVIVAF